MLDETLPIELAGAKAFDPFAHDDAVEHTTTPLWREAGCGLEWARLRFSPTWYGVGVPRGNGETVLLIPGFLCGDAILLELRRWLKRIGYRPALSRISVNYDCPNHTLKRLIHRVNTLADANGGRVTVIGHSLGGMLAKCLAQAIPERIERTITLGSPIQALVKAHPAVIGIWDILRLTQGGLVGRNLLPSCGSGHCTCDFVRHLNLPRVVAPPQYSIYSKTDGVVDWSSCEEAIPAHNTCVNSTHTGMVFNAEVYRAIAARLAEPAVRKAT